MLIASSFLTCSLFVCVGRGLYGAVTCYKSLCEELQFKVDKHRLSLFNEFFFGTFMTHYRLYQMVTSATPDREILHSHLQLPICQPPASFPPLHLGIEPDIWQYEKTIKEIEESASKRQQQRKLQKEMVDKEDAAKIQTVRSTCYDRLTSTVDQPVSLYFMAENRRKNNRFVMHLVLGKSRNDRAAF